jgi:inorganic pyrophosphatase
MKTEYSRAFWEAIDSLVAGAELVIDRPKGSSHPKFPEMVYPLDYGYLSGTSCSADGHEIDIWRGSASSQTAVAVICTVDLTKKDAEVKILIGCTPEEIRTVLEFHNNSEYMKGLLIERGS